MIGLSNGERISMIRSAVLIQYTRVTDGRTDRQTELAWHNYTRYSIYAVARKNPSFSTVCLDLEVLDVALLPEA